MDLNLHGHSLSYQLRIAGYEVGNVLTFQAHMASPQNIHLCILDTHHSLSYYQYTQNKWRKIHTWSQVSWAYQSILHEDKGFHVILHFNGDSNHYVFNGENLQILELPCNKAKGIPYRVFLIGKNDLVLIKKEIQETAVQFYGQTFSLEQEHWSEEFFICSIPKNYRKLQCWLFQDVFYLGYFTPQGNTHKLCLLICDIDSGLCQEEHFLGFSSLASDPVLTLLNNELILLVVEPNVLVCRRSADGGKTWNTKMELPCPWPLKLAPVINHRQEITPYVSIEGVYNLSFRQPAVMATEELLFS